MHVMSDVTLHVNMTPLKGWIVEKIVVKFPARQWKWHVLFDILYE